MKKRKDSRKSKWQQQQDTVIDQGIVQQKIIKAVTHIRLGETNPGKLAALDALASVYLALCQQYVTLFCTDERPDKFRDPLFTTALSDRWQRVAIQQAAGIAKSWRTNRANVYQDYLDAIEDYRDALKDYEAQQQVEEMRDEDAANLKKKPVKAPQEPTWKEWSIPTLRQLCIQANANVVGLEASEDSTFDYWLRISTLISQHPLRVPVKLADYHREALKDQKINSSVTLNKRNGVWWLTLTYDKLIPIHTQPDAEVVGIDVGIANFLTTSTGKHYGTFHKKLRKRHQHDREKRRRKAKLRACLEKKGGKKLPSTSSRSGQRLARHVRQEINRAVNQCFTEHEYAHLAYEQLSVSTMKFKARAQNAYLYASNLAHIPRQIEWNAQKRGVQATLVKSAYSSQECHMCYYTDRKNRPNQQTFCCQVCHHEAHADENAAQNIARRVGDSKLQTCKNRKEIKALLMRRHEQWKKLQGWP
jgi:transposase